MDLLPDDVLADILGRLPPCSLAVSRCIRKDWCAIIDTRRLLRADLLPLRLDGFFCLIDPYRNTEAIGVEHYHTVFFARPSTARRINGDLDLLWDDDHDPYNPWVFDHCNGLVLLCSEVIFNPATGQSVRLPPFPRIGEFYKHQLIAYDPITSPQHYEVLLFLSIPNTDENNKDSEWPPSSLTAHVFSSRKWRWEERSFIREGEAAGTIADMNSSRCRAINCTVYLRGTLYVPCPNNFIMRITLWNNSYQIVKVPDQVSFKEEFAYLGKSQKGVYCALLYGWSQFRVWLLDESGEMEWVLKSDINLNKVVETSPINDHADGYNTRWIVNYENDVSEAHSEDESEWDFESGMVLHESKDNKIIRSYNIEFFLGFHPYKEIVFFLVSSSRVISYHLNSSKIQELGVLRKKVIESFPYTPCCMAELFEKNS